MSDNSAIFEFERNFVISPAGKTNCKDAETTRQFSYVGLQAQLLGEFHARPAVCRRGLRARGPDGRSRYLRNQQLFGDRTRRQEMPQPDPQTPPPQPCGDHRRDGMLRAAQAAGDRRDRGCGHRVEQQR